MKLPKQWRWLMVAVIGLLLAGVFCYPLSVLTLTERTGSDELLIPLLQGKSFTYEFIHSVQKTPVQEHFVAAPENQILLTSTTYQSYGAGLPFLPSEGKLTINGGKFSLEGLNRHYKTINIGYMPLAHQSLLYGGQRYDLGEYFLPGTLIKIEIKHYTPVRLLWKQAGNLWGG